ncbi:MAG: 3-phosphoshikimate 1-carboxyvinyltransferase [Acidobacteriia bacterium]|nr:3-phosphoshikimate 1-carboxyvinyltransferase [Terriglobia bacterium]
MVAKDQDIKPFEDKIQISPCTKLRGSVSIPGDKSISHRLAMLASIAEGESTIANFSTSADCHSTLECLRALGIDPVVRDGTHLTILGRGLTGFRTPGQDLNAGNSGSTLRMLSGILAGQPFTSILSGDASLCRRPMDRVMEPLSRMGARFEAREHKYPPLTVSGTSLRWISYSPTVSSAQVKTAILFAGLLAEGVTEVIERVPTRNHTEIALPQFGAAIEVSPLSVSVTGRKQLHGSEFIVPGDPSSAAFFVVAGLLVPDAELTLHGVGLNPTRIEFFEFVRAMGGRVQFLNLREQNGEPVGDVVVRSSELEGGSIAPHQVPLLIDEIPILAVAGARSRKGLSIRGAQELRVKESDRIAAVVKNLAAMGAEVKELDDGFEVKGNQRLRGTDLESFGDHRIAMAFSVAALLADSPAVIHGADCVKISFPSFFSILHSLRT